MRLIAASEPIPLDHYVQEEIQIPAIDPESVGRLETERIDVSDHSSGGMFRNYIQGPTTLFDHSGKELISAGSAIISAALKGGGTYRWIDQNDLFWVQTREEYEVELEAELEREAQERAYDYW